MRALATGAAAMSALLFPCSLLAQEAAPNIVVTHMALSHPARSRARVPLAILPTEHLATSTSEAMTTSGDLAALGIVKSHAIGREWESGAFHLADRKRTRLNSIH